MDYLDEDGNFISSEYSLSGTILTVNSKPYDVNWLVLSEVIGPKLVFQVVGREEVSQLVVVMREQDDPWKFLVDIYKAQERKYS